MRNGKFFLWIKNFNKSGGTAEQEAQEGDRKDFICLIIKDVPIYNYIYFMRF